MKKEQRHRWCVVLLGLSAAGAGVIVLCSRFRGFSGAYTAPLILGGICLISGCTLLLLHTK